MVSFALIATLLAAATNGLILPLYLLHYKEAAPETISAINPILRYGFTVNLAFDYIYTGAFCLAILSWSIAILTRPCRFISWILIVAYRITWNRL